MKLSNECVLNCCIVSNVFWKFTGISLGNLILFFGLYSFVNPYENPDAEGLLPCILWILIFSFNLFSLSLDTLELWNGLVKGL